MERSGPTGTFLEKEHQYFRCTTFPSFSFGVPLPRHSCGPPRCKLSALEPNGNLRPKFPEIFFFFLGGGEGKRKTPHFSRSNRLLQRKLSFHLHKISISAVRVDRITTHCSTFAFFLNQFFCQNSNTEYDEVKIISASKRCFINLLLKVFTAAAKCNIYFLRHYASVLVCELYCKLGTENEGYSPTWKKPFHFTRKIPDISNGKFWLIGKRPFIWIVL